MIYSSEVLKEGERFAYLQLTQKRMADLWGVSEQTIVNWKNQHPEFAAALQRGYSKLIQDNTEIVVEGAKSDPKLALEILQRRDKENWGDAKRVDVGNADGVPFETYEKSNEERALRLAAIVESVADIGGDEPDDSGTVGGSGSADSDTVV